MASEVSSLVKDLSTVPAIIGSLGLSIAAAQKAFNLDYIENLEALLKIAKNILGDPNVEDDVKFTQFKSLLTDMVRSLAPARYQFTETTLKVKLDLAQTMSTSTQLGFGMNTGAVAFNLAMASTSGYDAHSAAEVTTVLHAILPDKTAFDELLKRADLIDNSALTLPSNSTVDEKLVKASSSVFEKLTSLQTELAKKEEEHPGNGGNDTDNGE